MKFLLWEWSCKWSFKRIERPKAAGSSAIPAATPIHVGRVCNVCGEEVRGNKKAKHLLEHHPEYAFSIEYRPTTFLGQTCPASGPTYVCSTCAITCGSVAGVVRHYRKRHPDLSRRGFNG